MNNGMGVGNIGDPQFTLSAAHSHAVVYSLDQQGGKSGANYSENVMMPILSDSHGTPHGVVYAVSTEGKSKADATEELAPTLTVTKKSKCTAVCYERQKVVVAFGGTDSNASITDGTVSPCILARAGTGGGNEPMIVVKTYSPNGNYCGAYEESETSSTLQTKYHYGGGVMER